ncbi:kinase-like protein [Xylariaceae sp. FL0255]|nr:kinase-like protein [Xylariaceae sp. FL0255]
MKNDDLPLDANGEEVKERIGLTTDACASDESQSIKQEVESIKDDAESKSKTSVIEYSEIGSWVEGIEDVQTYNKGGHHPVHLGDVLDGRYEVIHKLGTGGFSLVWLCHDIQRHIWRAVKILTAEHSAKSQEMAIYDHLRAQSSLSTLEANHIIVPESQFWIDGPNGRHLCLVLPVLGTNLSDWKIRRPFMAEQRLSKSKEACRQITRAVRFLHNYGVCHGDLKPQNILMRLHGIDKLEKTEILKLMGEPELCEVETASGEPPGPHAPKYIVIPPEEQWWKDFLSDTIALVDFGTSFFSQAAPPKRVAFTRLYAAPETFFDDCGITQGPYSDIWSLGCTLLELCTDDFLFASLDDSIRDAPSDLEVHLGPIPGPYRTAWRHMQQKEADRRRRASGQSLELSSPIDDRLKASEPVSGSIAELQERRENAIGDSQYSTAMEAIIGCERQRRTKAPKYKELPPNKRWEVVKYSYPRHEVVQFSSLLRRMFTYDPNERADIDEHFAVSEQYSH